MKTRTHITEAGTAVTLRYIPETRHTNPVYMLRWRNWSCAFGLDKSVTALRAFAKIRRGIDPWTGGRFNA